MKDLGSRPDYNTVTRTKVPAGKTVILQPCMGNDLPVLPGDLITSLRDTLSLDRFQWRRAKRYAWVPLIDVESGGFAALDDNHGEPLPPAGARS
jgi:hypothetical protein